MPFTMKTRATDRQPAPQFVGDLVPGRIIVSIIHFGLNGQVGFRHRGGNELTMTSWLTPRPATPVPADLTEQAMYLIRFHLRVPGGMTDRDRQPQLIWLPPIPRLFHPG